MTTETILLDPEPADALASLSDAMRADEGRRGEALRGVCARWPTFLDAWARLAEQAYDAGDDVASYAFCRVGYHRGLDKLRGAGWRGAQQVPWDHEPNRGFLRALHGLMCAAAAMGEGVEARRCREFLLQLDPADPFEVGPVRPAALSRRVNERKDPK